MTADEIKTAKAIFDDYQGFSGKNMIGIDTAGLPPYRKYLKNIKGLSDEAVENSIKMLLDYLRH